MPLQIVLDDVGWWRGRDDHERSGPYRTGIARNHVPVDYEAIASLGRRLNMRPQAAMVLCEWDRDDLLREVPSSTWMGRDWTNRQWVGPWLDEAADIMRKYADHFEICLHGLGHEYWTDGVMSRAEWHDKQGRMRPADDVRRHLDYCVRILERNGLGGMPASFVPCAFLHRFGAGEKGFASIAGEYGIRYISTPFATMHADRPTEEAMFGIDEGLMTADRGRCSIPWHALDASPDDEIAGPILGLHWPNVLHEDPARNEEVVERWVAFLEKLNRSPDRMPARNTRECWTQLAYRVCTEMKSSEDGLEMDFARLDRLAPKHLDTAFTMKISTDRDLRFRATGIQVESATRDAVDILAVRLRRDNDSSRATLRWINRC